MQFIKTLGKFQSSTFRNFFHRKSIRYFLAVLQNFHTALTTIHASHLLPNAIKNFALVIFFSLHGFFFYDF